MLHLLAGMSSHRGVNQEPRTLPVGATQTKPIRFSAILTLMQQPVFVRQ